MATENSGAPHLPPSWPDAPRQDAPSWPDPPRSDVPTSWPSSSDAGRPQPSPSWPSSDGGRPQPGPSWPEPAPGEARPHWPEPARDEVPTGWPQSAPPAQPAWPESAPPAQGGQGGWPETGPGAPAPAHNGGAHASSPWPEPSVQPPVPAWAEPPARPPAAWANLSSPAPWPQQDAAHANAAYDRASAPPPGQTVPGAMPPHDRAGPYDQGLPPQGGRADTYNATHDQTPLDDRGTAVYGQGASPLDPAPRHQAAHPLDDRATPHGGGHSGGHSGGHGPGHGGGQGGQGGRPADDRTMTYAQQNGQPGGRVDERPGPDGGQPGDQQPGPGRPGHNLSRDPSDPDRPFVTAGQISGSRTPPPERQQELWNTVFGDNYQAMGEGESLDDDPGKPIWIYALAGSVAIALVGALLWAFLAGPLAGEDPPKTNVAEVKATPSATATKKPVNAIGPLPKYRGTAAPVIGTVPNAQAGITVPRLGGTWRLDQRTTVKGTYGFDTRQYALIDADTAGQILTGPLPTRLTSFYSTPDDLEPVIKAVVVDARKRFFPEGNKVRKIAQQSIKVGDATGRLMAYSLTSPTEKATIVTAAINTGGQVPAIVYMSIPSEGKTLLPDVNTVVKRLALSQG